MYPTFCSMSPRLNHSYIKLNMSRRKPINGCPTPQFYPSSTPLYLLMPKRWDSSFVSFSSLHPSTNPSPIPKRLLLKMSFDSIYFFVTLQPLPIVQTIIIFHLTTPGARDRFPTHTVVPLWSILQKLAAWFILTQIKLSWWTVNCSIPILLCCLEVGNDVSPSRVTLAAKNCLAPSHIPSWGGSYPMMVQCGGLNTQPSQHHWDHSGEPLLPVRSAKAVMGPQPQITSSLCPILFLSLLPQILIPRARLKKKTFLFNSVSDCILRNMIYSSLLLP